ncbi:unnamed protein product [Larinioides sclopetarius]|uniref:Carboxylesterase type B domain-containing protein n=1 Tax=Larinioides sclopetarius TaxID=280406 RepID=A0AAV2B9B8_9ARAC
MKIVTLTFLIAVLWQASGEAPVVKTPLGEIEGLISNFDHESGKMFVGIPYATPPLEDLRFLKPEPVEAWDGVLQAKKQRPACMQYTEAPYPWYNNFYGTSEDCLYLNIYTPIFANEKSNLAVLFWIHGGGFTLGSNVLDKKNSTTLFH